MVELKTSSQDQALEIVREELMKLALMNQIYLSVEMIEF